MSPFRVDQLCVGWLVRESGIVIEAHSTSSIILGGRQVIVVDTSDRALREKVLGSLAGLGLRPEDVGVVVNTHGHGDHTSNNDLFINARKIVHREEGLQEGYEAMTGETLQLVPGVTVVHTPGHTRGAVSVFVEAGRRTAIAGDALPTKDNYVKRLPPALNYDPGLALRSMERIIEWADVIVPGHGPAFEVEH